jgi:hypothetical protein
MQEQRFKAQGNRFIEINHNLKKLKTKAIENLEIESGKKIYSKRDIETEPVFENIKQKKGFKRFLLTKVNIEFAFVAIAHYFSKWIAKIRLHNFRPTFSLKNKWNKLLGHFFIDKFRIF